MTAMRYRTARCRWFTVLGALSLLGLSVIPDALACRFTVRDVGFVDLGKPPYRLYGFVKSDTPEEAVGTFRRIARAADCLASRDRKLLIEALALPHLDGCQTALAAPSAAATHHLTTAYHKAARVAVWGLQAISHRRRGDSRASGGQGTPGQSEEDPFGRAVRAAWKAEEAEREARQPPALRSETALAQLRWASWEQRRVATRAVLTAKIFRTGEPQVLRQVLREIAPAVLHDRHTRHTRSMTKGLPLLGTANATFGEKAFGRWGPKVLRAIAEDAVFERCEEEPVQHWQEDDNITEGRRPPDEWAAVRTGWRGYLQHKFRRAQTVRDVTGDVTIANGGVSAQRADGTVLVWTD